MTEPSDPHRDLAGVLHDVSNALTVLLGWVGEARAPGATPEAVAYALTIIDQRARIARDLARHAIGGARVDEQQDLVAVVEEVGKSLVVEAQRTNVRIIVKGGVASAKVAGALDVSQILTNILLNALAYAPPGSAVDITVGVEDDHCTIVVADEGPGVAPERRESVFLGDSLRPGGTGVGLRHSRALARGWGGDVALLAHEGKGARFRITWPRTDSMPRPPVSVPRLNDPSPLSGLRVLVVEDDSAVTQLLETALEARGAEITIAATAAALTAALGRGPYDAALVDLSPIAADTPGALTALRARCPDATVVLVTGNADATPDVLEGVSVELVRKPFEVREVLAVLGRVARRREPGRG